MAKLSFDERQNAIDGMAARYINANPRLIEVAKKKDPVFTGKPDDEVKAQLACYPGVIALAVHEQAHALYKKNHADQLEARQWAEAAHTRTGIDIHPGTAIGDLCFIDHGTGLVVGETAKIGKNDLIYHNVTLGAYGTAKETHRRHPEIGDNCTLSTGVKVLGHVVVGDNVTIGPGATLLGNDTTVGDNVTVGAEAIIDKGNQIANNVRIGARAVIAKNTGVIDIDVADDARVSRGKDGALELSKTEPAGFAARFSGRNGEMMTHGAGI